MLVHKAFNKYCCP